MTTQHLPLLERLTAIADHLGLPIEVGLFQTSPPPTSYLVATPLADMLDVFADNQPEVQIEEVRLSVFTTANYLPLRDSLTNALLDAGVTVTARRYVGFEPDTGYHHYSIDTATYQPR